MQWKRRSRSVVKGSALLALFFSQGLAQSYISQTFAGGGIPDDENALTAHLSMPAYPVVDAQGGLYVSLEAASIVVRVAGGMVVRVAGNGTQGFAGDGGPARDAELAGPTALAVDHFGNLYIYDSLNSRIRKVDAATGTITTVAGNAGNLTVDPAGNLYISDQCRVIKVDGKSGVSSTFAGTGACGFAGDGGPATAALIGGSSSVEMAADALGNLYLADSQRIRKIDAATGTIRTIAGGGSAPADGVPATSTWLDPSGVAVDLGGNIYIAESSHYRIREVNASSGMISTVAGTGVDGYGGDGGPATSAELGDCCREWPWMLPGTSSSLTPGPIASGGSTPSPALSPRMPETARGPLAAMAALSAVPKSPPAMWPSMAEGTSISQTVAITGFEKWMQLPASSTPSPATGILRPMEMAALRRKRPCSLQL